MGDSRFGGTVRHLEARKTFSFGGSDTKQIFAIVLFTEGGGCKLFAGTRNENRHGQDRGPS